MLNVQVNEFMLANKNFIDLFDRRFMYIKGLCIPKMYRYGVDYMKGATANETVPASSANLGFHDADISFKMCANLVFKHLMHGTKVLALCNN